MIPCEESRPRVSYSSRQLVKELNSVRPLKRKGSLEESFDHSTEETSDSDDFETSLQLVMKRLIRAFLF